jgi:hypothetical protein
MGDPVIRGSRLSLLPLANCRFQFKKRRQLFIRVHNETLSVVAMCVGNEDCLPADLFRLRSRAANTFTKVARAKLNAAAILSPIRYGSDRA